MKISYNWLKWYIPDAPPRDKLAGIITYHLAEVESVEHVEHRVFNKEEDYIFDIKILPNRAHDLLSHMGVGRELASLLNIPYTDPTSKYKIPESKPTQLKIEVESNKCRRYMGRIVRNVKVGPSPEWVVKHLESIGQRSINNMVDAANLAMFNCGQPTHVFDLDKVSEKIVVRLAKEGETVTTLDNKDLKLKATDLVIADAKRVQGVAGVKGGKPSEVDENTKNIVLECANFDMYSIRRTAMRYGLFTDAVTRFNKGQSTLQNDRVLAKTINMLREVAGGKVASAVQDVNSGLLSPKLDLSQTPSSPDRITSATNSFSSPRLSFRQDGQVDVAMAPSPSDKTVFAQADSVWERTILRQFSTAN